MQVAVRDGFADDRLKPWFINRDNALLQALNLAGIDVDAHYLMPHVRQTCASHQTYIARTENRNFHFFLSAVILKMRCLNTPANVFVDINSNYEDETFTQRPLSMACRNLEKIR